MYSKLDQVNVNVSFPLTDPHADPSKVPRHSSPMSFLPRRSFFLAMLMLFAFSNLVSTASAASDCVCKFDPNVDYFPNKLYANYSKFYSIEYFKSYKKLTVIKGADKYVTYAYLCGTPVPNEGNVNNTIQIPVKSVAITSATSLPMVEYIGRRQALVFVSVPNTKFSSCMNKIYEAGNVLGGYSLTSQLVAVNATAGRRFNRSLDVVFADDYGYSKGLSTKVMDTLSVATKTVLVRASYEAHPLGRVEWTEFAAALFNQETTALNVVTKIQNRYNCVKKQIQDSPPPAPAVKVLWGSCYYYRGILSCYPGSCPNYYCTLIQDAGATLVTAPKFSMNATEFYNYVQQADVWIFTNANWNTSSEYSAPLFNGTIADLYSGANVVQNKRVWDILGKNLDTWFDDALAEPDVLLMDLVQAIHGTRYIGSSRVPYFLRNVFTQQAHAQGVRPSSGCVDENAALYTGWEEGYCTGVNAELVVGQPDRDLCASTGSMVESSMVSLIVVSVFAMMALI